jgi:CRISPR-associated endoribonuclease Cas6
MMIAITLALASDRQALLPPDLGRANYAATLARLAALDSALAAAVHEGEGPKPLTCSGLLNAPGNREGVPVRPGERYYVRVTALSRPIAEALAQGLLQDTPTGWELDRHRFRVEEAICDETRDAWSGQATYDEMAASRLLPGESLPRQVTLHFASPTSFRSGGRHVPLPLPDLVFGSLADRWNAFSGVQLSAGVRRFGAEMVAISNYRLQSRPVTHKAGGLRIGGAGRVTYHALSADRYWLSALHTLADYARFAGVGVQTTTGMGQARRLD